MQNKIKDVEFIRRISDEIGNVPSDQRFFINIGDLKTNSPTSLVYWWGYWYPDRMIDEFL
jgi:hypothetical protein